MNDPVNRKCLNEAHRPWPISFCCIPEDKINFSQTASEWNFSVREVRTERCTLYVQHTVTLLF